MNSMRFMQALGDIPEELVKCYFDENEAAENTAVSFDSDIPAVPQDTKPEHAEPVQNSDSAPRPAGPSGRIQNPLPVSLIAVAACLVLAVGWGVLIHRMHSNPITIPDDSADTIWTQDESVPAPITDNPDSQLSGSDSSAHTTTTDPSTQTSAGDSDQNGTAAGDTTTEANREPAAENTLSVQNTTSSPVTEPTVSSGTTAVQTESTAASETTATTGRQVEPAPLVGADIIRRYILGEWQNADSSSWEADNPGYVSQPYYQALSDADKTEIQQKISLLEARPNIGYAMKLRHRIMGMDSETRMTAAELKEYLSAHAVTDDESESELCSLIGRTNRCPDVVFGSGVSYSYHFLDESGKYSVYTVDGVNDESPLFVYFDEETEQLLSVPLRDALSVIRD